MEGCIKEDEGLRKDLECLLTIKGISLTTAIVFLMLFSRYEGLNKKQVVALLGLDPVIRESGSIVRGRSKISKQGNGIMQAILYYGYFKCHKV